MTFIAKGVYKRSLRKGNGLETLVDVSATGLFVLFSLLSFLLLLTFSLPGLIAAFTTFLTGYFQWLILRCVAEHLRLQKMMADVPFEGNISGPREDAIWVCSHCGAMLHAIDKCESCGAVIEEEKTGGA